MHIPIFHFGSYYQVALDRRAPIYISTMDLHGWEHLFLYVFAEACVIKGCVILIGERILSNYSFNYSFLTMS